VDRNILFVKETNLSLYYKNTVILTELTETGIIKWLEIYIYNIFVIFCGRVFSIHSTLLQVHTVLLFQSTCTFIGMRQTSCRSFSRRTNRNYMDPSFF